MFNHVSSGVHFSGASPYFSGKIDPAFLQKWPVPVRLCFRLRHSAIRMIRLFASTSIRVLFDYFAPDRGTEYLMSMSVLSVCPAVCVCVFICRRPYLRNYTSDLHQFLCMLPMAVARSCCGGVVIRYVLPVLWMTSYLLISQGCSTSSPS